MKSTSLANSLEIKNSMSYTVTGIALTSRQNPAHNRSLFVVSLVLTYWKTHHKEMIEQLDQFYLLTDKKPNEAHSNRNGHVLYYVQVLGFMQGHWNYPPSDATHWMMLPDPPEPAPTEKELLEKEFEKLLKDEFPDPIVSNILIEPVLKKFFFRGKTL